MSDAIAGIDLADNKQMVVVCDRYSNVAARRTLRCKAWDLGAALGGAAERAGHRWRVLGELAGRRSMPSVCVQPALTLAAQRAEDLTMDKTDGRTQS